MSLPLTVTDMHTGGEPLRIITSGYPELPRGTILKSAPMSATISTISGKS
jgi:proline racemase